MTAQIPEYALGPLVGFIDYWANSRRLLDLSIEGLEILKQAPEILEGIRNQNELFRAARQIIPDADAISEPPAESILIDYIKKAQSKADFVEQEIKAGFPLLHAQTLVGAWAALEAAIEDLLVGILINEPQFLEQESFKKIRIPLAEFEALDKEDRMRLLLEESSRHQSLAHKNGADAFEELLDKFSLSGAINAEVKRTLWEINHVRNVIVHRNSYADRRIVRNCPWLKLQVNDKVIVTGDQLKQYGVAFIEYAGNIVRRLHSRYGVSQS